MKKTLVESFCRSILLKKLKGIQVGRIEIIDRSGEREEIFIFGEPNATATLKAKIIVTHPRAFAKIALGGSIGTGESYVNRYWESNELTELVQIFVANRDVLMKLDSGIGALFTPLQRLFHRLRKNSVPKAEDNIRAHYDLGNDFFALFLDSTWMYSCGIFKTNQATLFDASTEKNDRICRKLNLTEKDHLLEIGTGWGGFALHAAQKYGCRVTTTTISQAQYDLALQRVEQACLGDRIQVLLKDYRLLEGQYDKIVSIEMIEAVGLEFLDTYFEKCSSLLKPQGQMLLQGITIRDQYFEYAKKNVDFIQKYIFPGGSLPSIHSIAKSVANKTDMKITHQEDFAEHYARTLRLWSERLKLNAKKVTELGYSEDLYRLWQFYFKYCEGGFLERSIGCVQILLEKPKCRAEAVLGQF